MIRSALGKVAWMARATTTVVGLAIMLALVLGVATSAMGANGGNFILGKVNNAATAVTGLVGNVDGAAMRVTNTNAGANDTALDLRVQAGEAPMRVNSGARVANLNADRLDGKHASDFFPAGGTLPRGTTLRGNFEIDADADEDTSTTVKHSTASNAISFGFALASVPAVHTIDINESPPPECPGTASIPKAAPGHLCIYESYEENERDDLGINAYPNTLNITRYGTGLYTQSKNAGLFFVSRGTWAVTAP